MRIAKNRHAGEIFRMNSVDLALSATSDAQPPVGISPSLKAMWFAKAGQWDAAHDLCQEVAGVAGSWIHAYLHREEGDLPNAGYWYARAGKEVPAKSITLAEEWAGIVDALG